MEKQSLNRVSRAIESSWGRIVSPDPQEWHTDNPMRGQSVSTALVVQDYLGGDIECVSVTGPQINDEKHYFNKLDDGLVVDLTVKQYVPLQPVKMTPKPSYLEDDNYSTVRDRLLGDRLAKSHYEVLRSRVAISLGEKALGIYDMSIVPEDTESLEKLWNLKSIFGVQTERVLAYLAADNPESSQEQIIGLALGIMPTALAYMMPANPETLADAMIDDYEAYKPLNRS